MWAVDPAQVYRRPWYPPTFDRERVQNPGLARHYDYSAIVVGPSHAQNFSVAAFERETGRKTLKLSISGGSAREQKLTAEVALRTGRVQVAYWAIDPLSLAGDPAHVADGVFPSALYNDSPLDDLTEYLLSGEEVLRSLRILRRHCCRRTTFDDAILESRSFWADKDLRFGWPVVLEAWTTAYCRVRRQPPVVTRGVVESARVNIEPVIRQYPRTRFVLFLPPYSRLFAKVLATYTPDVFQDFLALRAYIYGLGREPNVEVFDFGFDHEITGDLTHYQDTTHFDPGVNARMVTAFRDGRFRVRPEEAHARLDEFVAAALAYPLPDLPRPTCPELGTRPR